MMRKLNSLLIVVVCLSFGGLLLAHAGDNQSTPSAGSKEFERMKQLVGTWEGTSNMGKEGEKVKVEYRLTAGGSALVETLFPGTPEEMVSVYYDQDGKLAMTHYCMLRNQPHMILSKADPQTIDLVFGGKGNVLDPVKEKHMHALLITFPDKDHLVQKWTLFDKGKDQETVTLKLARVH
jgi:hypothetical protein